MIESLTKKLQEEKKAKKELEKTLYSLFKVNNE